MKLTKVYKMWRFTIYDEVDIISRSEDAQDVKKDKRSNYESNVG